MHMGFRLAPSTMTLDDLELQTEDAAIFANT